MQHFNATKDARYIELFADKPEMVIDWPEWLLSDQIKTMISDAYPNKIFLRAYIRES
jgi:hypothetical protein